MYWGNWRKKNLKTLWVWGKEVVMCFLGNFWEGVLVVDFGGKFVRALRSFWEAILEEVFRLFERIFWVGWRLGLLKDFWQFFLVLTFFKVKDFRLYRLHVTVNSYLFILQNSTLRFHNQILQFFKSNIFWTLKTNKNLKSLSCGFL